MFELIAKHQFGAAVAIYWIFSAAVSAMPEPDAQSHPGYLWLYRFAHTTAGNITTVFGSRIPGLKILCLLLAALLVLPAQGCAAHYTVHPGALNQTDSAAYDALLIAETVIDQAKAAAPGPPAGVLKRLIDSYNVARESWLTYRGALATNVPQPVYLDNLNKNLVDLTNAIRGVRRRCPVSLAIALEILKLALSLVTGPAANKAAVLVQIVGKALQAYEDQTGAPMDLSLIKPE